MHVCLPAVAWYLPAGHREHAVSVFQFPTKPALLRPRESVTDESLVNLTRMYPVVDVQLRLDIDSIHLLLLPLSDAFSALFLHDVALSDDEQL